MKGTAYRFLFLSVGFLVVLSACSPGAAPEPAGDSPATVAAAPPAAVDLAGVLGVGSAMQWYDNGTLVFVPAGESKQGSSDYEDSPPRTTYLDDFWIYKFQVTNDQYRLCVAAGACSPPANEPPFPDYLEVETKDRPVIGVDWEQAQTYCGWMQARLPTEAEWEKVARGPDGSPYPWGGEQPSCQFLNFVDCAVGKTSDVFGYPDGMSFYETFDMEGNAFEWVSDWYDPNYYRASPGENPMGPEMGEVRSVRGSSYMSAADLLPSARRFYLEPDKYRVDLGFRCVVVDPGGYAPYCEQIAYAPGRPPPWRPGPPNGGQGPGPEVTPEEPLCRPPMVDYRLSQYCSDQGTQTGGATVVIVTGYLGSYDAGCIPGAPNPPGSPVGCTGPDETSVEIELCSSCVPPPAPPELVLVTPSCDPGYTLNSDDPPLCEYAGLPPVPGGACPPGWVYDGGKDVCVEVVPASENCPKGYVYDPATECCRTTVTDPGPGLPGIPPDSYPGCPVGYSYYEPENWCYAWVNPVSLGVELCWQVEVPLGACREPGGGTECPPQSCNTGEWNANECCCYVVGRGCVP